MAASTIRIGTPLRDAAAPSDGEAGEDNLDDLTVAELRDHADLHDVDLTGTSRKSEIIDAIKASR